MSAILKALKKLENEQPRREQVQSLSGTVHLHKQKAHGAKRFRAVFLKSSGLGLLGLVVVAGGFIGFHHLSKEEPASTASVDVKAPAITPGAGAVSPVKKQIPPQESRRAQSGKSSHKRAEKRHPSVSRDAKNVPVLPVPEKPVIQKETVPESPTKTLAAVNTKMSPSLSPRVSHGPAGADNGIRGKEPLDEASPEPAVAPPIDAKSPEQDVPSDVKARGIPILPAGEGRLRLMAIAWSDDPESRMAVINGGIVREGGSIAGVYIEKINQDEVVVRKDNGVYRLVFKLK